MTHYEIWANAQPIEPETCRFVESIPELTAKLPDYLFAVPNDETGMIDIYVKPPPRQPLIRSGFTALLAPFQVCKVTHFGTGEVPYAALAHVTQCPHYREQFLREFPIEFTHVTTSGVQPMHPLTLRGYQLSVAPDMEDIPAEEFWLYFVALKVLTQ